MKFDVFQNLDFLISSIVWMDVDIQYNHISWAIWKSLTICLISILNQNESFIQSVKIKLYNTLINLMVYIYILILSSYICNYIRRSYHTTQACYNSRHNFGPLSTIPFHLNVSFVCKRRLDKIFNPLGIIQSRKISRPTWLKARMVVYFIHGTINYCYWHLQLLITM